jgi:hypothetical protein
MFVKKCGLAFGFDLFEEGIFSHIARESFNIESDSFGVRERSWSSSAC